MELFLNILWYVTWNDRMIHETWRGRNFKVSDRAQIETYVVSAYILRGRSQTETPQPGWPMTWSVSETRFAENNLKAFQLQKPTRSEKLESTDKIIRRHKPRRHFQDS
jgi:hypothetical protein